MTAGPVIIELAGEPRGKARLRFRVVAPKGGKAFATGYTPKDTLSYENALAGAAQLVMGDRALLEGPLRVRVVAAMPVAQSWPKKRQAAALSGIERPTKKPDADNILKMLDALNHVVWHDDAQIVDVHIEKFYSAKPSLRVEVYSIASGLLAGAA
jgi:Holliday junction resolvase RusA-like endonuclease